MNKQVRGSSASSSEREPDTQQAYEYTQEFLGLPLSRYWPRTTTTTTTTTSCLAQQGYSVVTAGCISHQPLTGIETNVNESQYMVSHTECKINGVGGGGGAKISRVLGDSQSNHKTRCCASGTG